MLGKKSKGLSTEEIRAAAEKLRKKYNDYIIEYLKPPEIKDGFEERYLYALRERLDMARFFLSETQVLNELIKEEDDIRQKNWNNYDNKKNEDKKEADFADRIMAEHEKRINKYPELKLHSESSNEIRRLFGALQVFEQEYWPNIQNMLRKYFKQFYSGARMGLESDIINLCCPNLNGIPPRLAGYSNLFERFPRDYNRIEKEEKVCLTEISVLLTKIKEEINRIFTEESLTDEEKGLAGQADIYINDLIMDFRLRDLGKLTKGADDGNRNYGR